MSYWKEFLKQFKEQKGRFLGTLLGTFGVKLLGNILTGNWIWRPCYGNKEGRRISRAGYGSKDLRF